jgi:hypothetical protein
MTAVAVILWGMDGENRALDVRLAGFDTYADLLATGLSRARIRAMVQHGKLLTPQRGIYLTKELASGSSSYPQARQRCAPSPKDSRRWQLAPSHVRPRPSARRVVIGDGLADEAPWPIGAPGEHDDRAPVAA